MRTPRKRAAGCSGGRPARMRVVNHTAASTMASLALVQQRVQARGVAAARLPSRRSVAVRAATALPADVRGRAGRSGGANGRACERHRPFSGSSAQSTPSHPLLPAGQDRHARGRPCVCEGGGGRVQDRGRHSPAQHGAEAADAGHRPVGGRRQGRQGAAPSRLRPLPALPCSSAPPTAPSTAALPAGGRQGGLLQVCGHRAGGAGRAVCAAQGARGCGCWPGSFWTPVVGWHTRASCCCCLCLTLRFIRRPSRVRACGRLARHAHTRPHALLCLSPPRRRTTSLACWRAMTSASCSRCRTAC